MMLKRDFEHASKNPQRVSLQHGNDAKYAEHLVLQNPYASRGYIAPASLIKKKN
jgi:hypothetical protein